jgi:hypothetical protein
VLRAVTFSSPGGCGMKVKIRPNFPSTSPFDDPFQIDGIRKKSLPLKGKAIPVTAREGTLGYETSRFPHLLDNRLTDGGEFVGLTRRPPFTPQEDSWYSFLLEAESTPGP